MKEIDEWTERNMMKLNEKKTTNMIFNFSKDHQFTTEIELKNEKIETLNQTKFLGVIITNNLKWHENTKNIVKNANRKMALLHRFPKFTKNKSHLMHLFKTQVGGAWSIVPQYGTVALMVLTAKILKGCRGLQ